MKFIIKHEISGRLRIHLNAARLTCREADCLLAGLEAAPSVTRVKVYERTADAVICYTGSRDAMLHTLRLYQREETEISGTTPIHSGRELNAAYQNKLISLVLLRMCTKLFLPSPVRAAWTSFRAWRYIRKGIRSLFRGRLEVSVLDAAAIMVSLLRRDTKTAGSVMFLLGIGEILEEWTRKKSVNDLARSMSLSVRKVWLKTGGREVLVDPKEISTGCQVVVHMGNVIPFDGNVTEGEGMVNQSSLTGEALPVHKRISSYVYAGTVLEEGEFTIEVRHTSGATRYEKIISMIEESEKLKSSLEGKAARLADRLVPYTLAGTGFTWLATGNTTKALAVLMVDFSCALKLAIPIAVLSAIREAGTRRITVKGGKYLEAAAEAETIVFDKTGTLTKARPTLKMVVPFCEWDENELLRTAACLEEHFPHSMAKAVVRAAQERGLDHEEMHSHVEYIVAHGISSQIDGKKVVIGSAHFVFDDEKCRGSVGYEERFAGLPKEYSHLYLAVENQLAAVLCIEDPLREEAASVIQALKKAGFKKVVMMTGDSERTAAAAAEKVGVDAYDSEVLPEDKARFIETEKAAGRKVVMVGDGINDSPALSAADVGIAVSDGAEIAREIADITISADNLEDLVALKLLSNALVRRIRHNYRQIVGINTVLILLGVSGILQPAVSATLHNLSTLGLSLQSMQNLLAENRP